MFWTREEVVTFLTEKEEETVNILVELGINENVAKVLVFLADTHDVTSREIESGTDLPQPKVSIALQYLMENNWITCHKKDGEVKGHPVKVYNLAKSIDKIMQRIETSVKNDLTNHLSTVQKLRDYIR